MDALMLFSRFKTIEITAAVLYMIDEFAYSLLPEMTELTKSYGC